MRLRLTPRALAEAKRKKTWWLHNRPAAPHLFEQELVATFDSILAMPTIGVEYPADFDVEVRRVLMPKTRNHVYFAVDGEEVVILSVWGAQRGRGPKL
ncbi:MAG: type II toxin-antitoxin system RelE/ParE family toxin [Polyangiaceae bacterium]